MCLIKRSSSLAKKLLYDYIYDYIFSFTCFSSFSIDLTPIMETQYRERLETGDRETSITLDSQITPERKLTLKCSMTKVSLTMTKIQV